MMYDSKHGYVIAILSDNKVLRENNGCVHLPFYSEYAIRIKNTNACRVGVKVSIDGTEINNSLLVLNRGETFDLKRMILDGDLCSGPSLLFVPKTDSRVQDPMSSNNGEVKVEFYPEKINNAIGWLYTKKHIFDRPSYRSPSTCATYSANINTCTNDLLTILTNSCDSQEGVTVAGKDITQEFSTTQFDHEYFPSTVLRIQLKGSEKTVFVQNTRTKYCDQCGRKAKNKAKFCSNCGSKL